MSSNPSTDLNCCIWICFLAKVCELINCLWPPVILQKLSQTARLQYDSQTKQRGASTPEGLTDRNSK